MQYDANDLTTPLQMIVNKVRKLISYYTKRWTELGVCHGGIMCQRWYECDHVRLEGNGYSRLCVVLCTCA